METPSQTAPMTLYARTGCRFCAKVLSAGDELGITFDLKNIQEWEVHEELEEKGGKVQVPYLIDTAHDVAMYEADAIVDYLHQTYGKGAVQIDDDTSSNTSCTL